MSEEQFQQFRDLVLRSRALQARLDTEEDVRHFVPLVVRLGAENGYEFRDADVEQALSAARRAWLERWLV